MEFLNKETATSSSFSSARQFLLIWILSKWKSVNAEKPDSPNYSILDRLDNKYKDSDGKFTFKIVWPLRNAEANHNVWKQSTNPVTETKQKVIGYEPIDIKFKDNYW